MVIVRMPGRHAHALQPLLKTPKILMNDTGLAIALLNLAEPHLLSDNLLRGRMLENFAGMELLKQISYAAEPYRLYHLRISKGREVNFLLENAQGKLLGIEVKASATVNADDFRHLRAVGEWLGERWAGGISPLYGYNPFTFRREVLGDTHSCLWYIA